MYGCSGGTMKNGRWKSIRWWVAILVGAGVIGSGGVTAEDAPNSDFRRLPAPTTITPEAQAVLDAPYDIQFATTIPHSVAEWKALQSRQDAQMASRAEGLAASLPLTVEETKIGGVTVRIVTPNALEETKASKALLNVHGGAYAFNAGMAGLASPLLVASHGGYRVYAVDYRMPPDHPFPAALEDTVAVYTELLETYRPSDIAIYGTSAGGGLAAATTLAIRDRGLPLPAAIAMNTPWSDLTKSGDSYVTLEGLDPALITYDGVLGAAAMMYAGGEDMKNPLISPIYADYTKGFPPSILITGTRDLFLSNTVRLHRELRDAGAETELLVFEGMWHGFFGVPEMYVAVDDFVAFFDKHLVE